MPETSGKGLSIVIVGASGDLARKKVIPALFALFCQGYLPEPFCIIGFARSAWTDDEFQRKIEPHLTCRYVPGEQCADKMRQFLGRCHYVSGQYASVDSYLELFQCMRRVECAPQSDRIFYMSVPPFLFLEVARAMGNAGLLTCGEQTPWSRVVIEKPFGRDRASSDELVANVEQVFSEDQTYRIDHYLGKEVIQNLLVLRFANLVFEPIWNSTFIQSVRISWKEDLGVGDRGGYFNEYGVIRDVIQNHLAQILALVAMEPPASFRSQEVSAAKTDVLKTVAPADPAAWTVGQYDGYLGEPGIPKDSITPTFAAGTLHIHNDRWKGVPFFIDAGKGLDERVTEIRIRFRHTQCCGAVEEVAGPLPPNELVIRVQPDELIRLGIVNKAPGLEMKLVQTWLNLAYKSAFETPIPEAYECLLLDIMQGDRSLFITREELAAAWDIFTPLLHDLEARKVAPAVYPFGTRGAGSPHAPMEEQ
ncbi:MAG TPA: glucose-6-phosphate dehydrogenase [Candidatus Bathyarchaeia archaeon]|nr:glucose-6-phosphate dehydrogenase [Candidatus Bathyarchaeia archaeon]